MINPYTFWRIRQNAPHRHLYSVNMAYIWLADKQAKIFIVCLEILLQLYAFDYPLSANVLCLYKFVIDTFLSIS